MTDSDSRSTKAPDGPVWSLAEVAVQSQAARVPSAEKYRSGDVTVSMSMAAETSIDRAKLAMLIEAIHNNGLHT